MESIAYPTRPSLRPSTTTSTFPAPTRTCTHNRPLSSFRTATTEDGKRSAQFEHQLIITKDGCEILTARTKDSPPLWWEESEDQRLARQTKDALNVA